MTPSGRVSLYLLMYMLLARILSFCRVSRHVSRGMSKVSSAELSAVGIAEARLKGTAAASTPLRVAIKRYSRANHFGVADYEMKAVWCSRVDRSWRGRRVAELIAPFPSPNDHLAHTRERCEPISLYPSVSA